MEKHKTKKLIGLDLDGVIIDHTELRLKLAKKFGWQLKPAQTQSEIMKKALPLDVSQKIEYYLYGDPKIALLSPLMPKTKTALREIKKARVEYFLISRRRSADLAIKLLKIRDLWPDFFNKQNTFFVEKPEDKNEKAKKLSITHYIDDQIKVLEKLANVENKFLFDKFDNFKDSGFTRVTSWPEFLNLVL